MLTALLVLLCSIATIHACSDDMDCSLNGQCTKSICVCDPAWRDSDNGKERCSILNTLPFPNDYVPAYGGPRTSTVWQHQNLTSWGGNIIQDSEGKYHLYVSAMAGGAGTVLLAVFCSCSCSVSRFLSHRIFLFCFVLFCFGAGLGGWGSISECHHATASDPMDVFRYHDTVLAPECHNASPLRAPNGSYLLFHIGSGSWNAADSPTGPWRKLPSIFVDGKHEPCNNPAPMFAKNGTAFVGCNDGSFQIYRSDDIFAGRWSLVTTLAFPPAWSSAAPGYLKNEDPYLWMDARGHFHLLAHRYDYRDGYPKNPNQTTPVLVSGHGYSVNGIDWDFNVAQQPYDAVIVFQNGTKQHLSTYERPHLVFDTETGQPTHLVNGVSPYWNKDKPCDGCSARKGSLNSCVVCKTTKGLDYTYTLVTALKTAA